MSNKLTNSEMLSQILVSLNGVNEKLDSIDKRVTALENQKSSKPSSPKGKPATTKEPKPQLTKQESIKAWAEKKYTPEERAAYGEQKRAERAKKHEAYEKANAFFTEKVDYKVWRAKYEEFLKA